MCVNLYINFASDNIYYVGSTLIQMFNTEKTELIISIFDCVLEDL